MSWTGPAKDTANTYPLMVAGLTLMGISQSLITLGCHTYLIKGVNVDANETGET